MKGGGSSYFQSGSVVRSVQITESPSILLMSFTTVPRLHLPKTDQRQVRITDRHLIDQGIAKTRRLRRQLKSQDAQPSRRNHGVPLWSRFVCHANYPVTPEERGPDCRCAVQSE